MARLLVAFLCVSAIARAEFVYDVELRGSDSPSRRVILPITVKEFQLVLPKSSHECILRTSEEKNGTVANGSLEAWCCLKGQPEGACVASTAECRDGKDGTSNFILIEPKKGKDKEKEPAQRMMISLFCMHDTHATPQQSPVIQNPYRPQFDEDDKKASTTPEVPREPTALTSPAPVASPQVAVESIETATATPGEAEKPAEPSETISVQ